MPLSERFFFLKGSPCEIAVCVPIAELLDKQGTRALHWRGMANITTQSARETKAVARLFAKEVLAGLKMGKKATVIALSGPLGAGKTTFAQGFASGLGVREKIKSPTFVLVKEYAIPRFTLHASRFTNFYHLDCYRLESRKETVTLGLKEILADPRNLVLIEWAEKIKRALPKKIITVKLFHVGENSRNIRFN